MKKISAKKIVKPAKKIKEINRFVMKRPHFFWWVPKKAFTDLSENSIVEATLNYGDMDDILEMIGILGIQKVKKIFQKQTRYKRNNYYKDIIRYFRLFFRKYAT